MVKYIDIPIGPDPLAALCGLEAEPRTVQTRRYTWNWIDGEHETCAILDASQEIVRFKTRFPSKFGLEIVDALDACQSDGRTQVSHHGNREYSVQVFDGDKLVLDVNVT